VGSGGLGGGRARRLSLASAVTFGLAVLAGVAGNRLTDRITPTLVVSAALVAAGMLVSYWVDRGTHVNIPIEGVSGDWTSPLMPQALQDITASAPSVTAQGATFGNVISYGDGPSCSMSIVCVRGHEYARSRRGPSFRHRYEAVAAAPAPG
jgi:hypothetical protein